jgi:hypothetical protein
MTAGNDFKEGVRALLVDKDNNPKWSPLALSDVTDDMLNSAFAPFGAHEPLELTLPIENSKL